MTPIDDERVLIDAEAVNAHPEDEPIFTALAKLEGFQSTYVVTCGLDPLRDDGLVLVKRLREVSNLHHEAAECNRSVRNHLS